MSFLDLPNEIILLISREQNPRELNSLLRVNRFLAALLAPALLDSIFRGRLSGYGEKALYSAAKYRDKARVRHLLARGILDFVGNGALLHGAVKTESAGAIVTLLECGIDPVARNLLGQTALFSAASYGKAENVRVLLDDGRVDVNSEDSKGHTPLQKAVSHGQEGVVQLLLDQGANVGSNPRHTPLLALAVKSQSEPVVRLLLNDSRVKVNELGPTQRTALHTAAGFRDPLLSRILLEEGKADINVRDFEYNTPLHVACLSRAPAVVALLLDNPGVNINAPNIQGLTPLHHATRGGDDETTRLLLSDMRIDPTPADGRRPRPHIHNAIRSGSRKIVRMLLSHGVDPNLKEPLSGLSALSLAILRKEMQIFRDLLADYRTNANQPNREGNAPLHQAVRLNRKAMLTCLVQEPRVHINQFNAAHETALHIACKNGASDLVEILLGHATIDVNLGSPSEETPLHMAVGRGHAMTVRALLKHHLIDRSCMDDRSRTPLSVARMSGNKEIIRMLCPCACSPQPTRFLHERDDSAFCAIHYEEDLKQLTMTRWPSPVLDVALPSGLPSLLDSTPSLDGPYLADLLSSKVLTRWPSPELGALTAGPGESPILYEPDHGDLWYPQPPSDRTFGPGF
ncbi:ankyrin [Tuber magnatum]|uniref:Ankyrin n=1 Tax=Tuber magnatum TaxID=42249 RepID=A0A317SMV1_9PEZI|nr:ankyrin [Tuber magnatum]